MHIVERMSYAAFGERRKGDWRVSDPLLPIIPALTNRGDGGVVATSCLHFLVTTSIRAVGEGCRVSYQYDINGNITNKSDVGDYSYNAVNGVNSTHPHTPNSIAGLKTHANNQDRTYTYDANGSMTKNGNKSITAIDVVLVTNGITIINIINLTGGA
jgi:hypothetical protein